MARKRTSTQSQSQPVPAETSRLVLWVRPACLFLMGLVISWSLLQPLDSTSVFDGSALPQNLGCLILAVGVALDMAVNQRGNRLTVAEALCLFGISLWILLGTLHAAGMCNPRTGWNGFWHLLSVFALYFSMRNLLEGAKLRSTAMLILLGGATVLAGLGVFQVVIEFPQARSEYLLDPEKVIAQLGMEAPPGSPLRQKLENRLNSPEPLATFSLANSLAVLLSGCLVLGMGALGFRLIGLASADQSRKARDLQRTSERTRVADNHLQPQRFFTLSVVLMLVMTGVVALIWYLTRSRIAYLSVPICLMLLAGGTYWQFSERFAMELPLATRRLIKRMLVALGVLVVMGLVWLGWQDPLVFTEAGKSLSYRVEYWVASVSMIRDHWLLGVGIGNFQTFYPRYMLASASETIADPHNWALDIASTCSLPVACVIAVGLACTLVRKPVATPADPTDPLVTASSAFALALGALLGGMVVLLGLVTFGLDYLTAAVAFLMMLVAGVLSYSVRSVVEPFVSHTNLGPSIMAISMLLCLLVSGSWQASGLVVPLVCCLAASQADIKKPAIMTNSWWEKTPLVFLVMTLAAFLWQSWYPVVQSNLEASKASASTSGKLAMIDRARQADHFNAQWDRFRAELIVEKTASLKEPATFLAAVPQALQAVDDWAVREPNSFLTGQFSGDRLLQLVEQANRMGLDSLALRRKASEFYAQAVRNRPTSVQLRVQLGYSLMLVGEKSAAGLEIAEATRLSENTPHEDQKLKSQLIWAPGAPNELLTREGKGPYCQAELVVVWIRKQLEL